MSIKVTYQDIYPELIKGLTNVSSLWDDTKIMMDKAVSDIFESEGGTWGVMKWFPIKSSMYGKVRKGTDGRDYGVYSSASRPLQASGNYKDSFRRISKRPLSMVYGSSYKFGSGQRTVSGDVIPYAGLGGIKPRQPMPDSQSGRFRAEMGKIEDRYLTNLVNKAVSQARTVTK